MFEPNEIAGFISLGKKLINNLPKFPPSFIILFVCTLLNFISVDILFLILSISLSFVVVANTIHEVTDLC